MDKPSALPRMLRILTAAALLAAVCTLAWFAPTQYDLHFQLQDVSLSLDTSRQREAKQTYEYNQVTTQLPLTQQALDAAQPLARDAKAHEDELRGERKALRARNKDLQSQLDAALASAADLTARRDALLLETDDLRRQEDALLQRVEALRQQLAPTP